MIQTTSLLHHTFIFEFDALIGVLLTNSLTSQLVICICYECFSHIKSVRNDVVRDISTMKESTCCQTARASLFLAIKGLYQEDSNNTVTC